jgi:dipeptidyl aminopeptidase/acylaminoacyl peptidase
MENQMLKTPKTAPYGSWKSPITSDLIVSKTIRLGGAFAVGDDVFWLESRPLEGGRNVLVRRTPDGKVEDITPSGFNIRTTVHEYGGRCLVVDDRPELGTRKLYFVNFTDQRLYVQDLEDPDRVVKPLTPEIAWRYADPVIDHLNGRLICVREDHTQPGKEPLNALVSISLQDGSDQRVLASGCDFYATPRLSPDGGSLAWLSWNHPNMPWDGCELWVASLSPGNPPAGREGHSLGKPQHVAGGLEESIFQPEWSLDGRLYFISDCSGWWNLYRWTGLIQGWGKEIEPLHPMEAEFGEPQWSFGITTYGFASINRLVCAYNDLGRWRLGSLDVSTGKFAPIETPYTDIYNLSVYASGSATKVLFNASSPAEPSSIISFELDPQHIEILQCSCDVQVDAGYLSIPELVEFPTENAPDGSPRTAYGYFYAPKNQDFAPPDGSLPPLMVLSHGGPTGSTSSAFSLSIQYWTSRGFAVLDVNYGGSTGYGRAYRERLNGQWGVVDVDDCCNGARYLAETGKVDPERLIIRGGSAGGYTTLSALAFRATFKAGASYYGIGDLETMATDTHKFESRYLDRLVGPYPESKDLYYNRSAIHFVDRISCPVILFQGLEDKVVPPSQSEMMFEAVRAKGLPVAYIAFEGEQHGFRMAENIKRSLDAELYFYSRIFGFDLLDPIEPVEIENL